MHKKWIKMAILRSFFCNWGRFRPLIWLSRPFVSRHPDHIPDVSRKRSKQNQLTVEPVAFELKSNWSSCLVRHAEHAVSKMVPVEGLWKMVWDKPRTTVSMPSHATKRGSQFLTNQERVMKDVAGPVQHAVSKQSPLEVEDYDTNIIINNNVCFFAALKPRCYRAWLWCALPTGWGEWRYLESSCAWARSMKKDSATTRWCEMV